MFLFNFYLFIYFASLLVSLISLPAPLSLTCLRPIFPPFLGKKLLRGTQKRSWQHWRRKERESMQNLSATEFFFTYFYLLIYLFIYFLTSLLISIISFRPLRSYSVPPTRFWAVFCLSRRTKRETSLKTVARHAISSAGS
jgi:hypothetical protein